MLTVQRSCAIFFAVVPFRLAKAPMCSLSYLLTPYACLARPLLRLSFCFFRRSELNLGNNSLTAIPASVLTLPRSSVTPNFRLGLERNNISFASMAATLAVISATSSSNAAVPPSSLALLGSNPACDDGRLVSRAGSWWIKCKPECALGCRETPIGELISWLAYHECHAQCDAGACGWNAHTCSGHI